MTEYDGVERSKTDYDWEMRELKFDHDMAMIDLEAENADLREQLADCRGANELLDWVNELLRDENAKLRELVKDLAICACGKYCYGCPHQYDGCDRDERLREMGIEVDE